MIGKIKYFLIFLVIFILALTLSISPVFADSSTQVQDFITRLYNYCLDREPDIIGLDVWVGQLISKKTTGAQVVNSIIFSQEFTARNTSNEEFLNILYRAFFNREPDTEGFSKWLNILNTKNARQYVLAGFVNSKEFKDLCGIYGINSGYLDPGSLPPPIPFHTSALPVIALHGIEPVPHSRYEISTGAFNFLLSTLKSHGYETITFYDLLNYFDNGKPLPPKPVIITSDDGYQSMYTNAFPILKKYGYKMTIFLITSYIGGSEDTRRSNEFDHDIEGIPQRPMLIWPEIYQMSKYGCEFQSHTWSHGIIRNMPIESSLKELAQSKTDIEVHTGKSVFFVSWPHGATSDEVIALLPGAGYRGALYAGGGIEDITSINIYGMSRIPILREIPPEAYVEWLELQ